MFDKEEIQEMIAIAAAEFATSNISLFMEFLKKNHPYLYQVYGHAEGEG